MAERQPVPFLIASSVTAEYPKPHRFSLERTIEIAQGRADGTQLYVNPGSAEVGSKNRAAQIKDMLAEAGLTVNVVHTPEYAVPDSFFGTVGHAITIASEILNPIPEIGKLCVVHHDPSSPASNSDIVLSAVREIKSSKDPNMAIGLEHFHPKTTTTETLPEQIDKYLELLYKMQQEIPTFAVFDTGRFYSLNNANIPPKPLDDVDFKLVNKMCEALSGQKVLVHATDKNDLNRSFRDPGVAVPIGTGVFAPFYQEMARAGRRNGIEWIGVVDETEAVEAISDRKTVQNLIQNA